MKFSSEARGTMSRKPEEQKLLDDFNVRTDKLSGTRSLKKNAKKLKSFGDKSLVYSGITNVTSKLSLNWLGYQLEKQVFNRYMLPILRNDVYLERIELSVYEINNVSFPLPLDEPVKIVTMTLVDKQKISDRS